jgi:hypothetical protein
LEYLAEPYVPARKRIWAVGPAESGKSIWAAHQAAKLTRAGLTVAYVTQENGEDEELRRFLRLAADYERLRLCIDQGLDLLLPDHRQALLELAAGCALVVLDTFTACWSGDENENTALAAFDRDVLKPVVAGGASILVLDHTGNPQAFVRRQGVSAPRGASTKGQKTDWLLDFRAAGESRFKIEHAKGRGGGRKQPPRTYCVVDVPMEDDPLGRLEVEEVEATESETAAELADLLVEQISEQGEIQGTKALRAAAKEMGYGTGVASAAVKLLREEEPRRVTVAKEVVTTGGGRQTAEVWRPVPEGLELLLGSPDGGV